MRDVQKSIAFYCFRTLAIGFSFVAFCSCNQGAMSVMAQEGDDKANDDSYSCKKVKSGVVSYHPSKGWGMGSFCLYEGPEDQRSSNWELIEPTHCAFLCNRRDLEEKVNKLKNDLETCKEENTQQVEAIERRHATDLETCRTENAQIKEKLEGLQRLVAQFSQTDNRSGSHGGDPNLLGSGLQTWQPYVGGGLVGIVVGMALMRYYCSPQVSRLKKELKKKEDEIDKLQQEKYTKIQEDTQKRIKNISSKGSLQGSTERRGGSISTHPSVLS